MPRPKPLVSLHGAVNFERLVPFNLSGNAPPIAPDDILVFRRAAGGDNLSVQVSDLGSAVLPDPILLSDGSALAPSFAFTSQPENGMFIDANDLAWNTTSEFKWFRDAVQVMELDDEEFKGSLVTPTWQLNMEDAASDTQPVYGFNNDGNTGLGRAGNDLLSIIAGGVEIARAKMVVNDLQFLVVPGDANTPGLGFLGDEDTGIVGIAANQLAIMAGATQVARAVNLGGGMGEQFIISPDAVQDAPTTPSLAFGDGDTGFYETVDDFFKLSIGGTTQWVWSTATLLGGLGGGSVAIRNVVSTSTIPNLHPAQNDLDTGVSHPGVDIVGLTAGGVLGFQVAESGSVITNTFFGDLIADGGGGAGPMLRNVSASPSVPTLIPNQADPDTGISRDGINGVSMVGGGLACLRGRNIGGARAVGFYTTTPIIQQTGVAVTAAAIHAACVNIGLFTA